ncbi:SDR family oxidoreductase [Halioxenophilus sp. WMMB6]|uniref:SDR family oxidoreductase n=1 Tax=Halioxenophilus sp. WMMB6 TaxID=3073815 RepID=UPI00295E520E|nr:SDR family oxidoreductase [Halioxenophilus sp. WMMB6]
MSDYGLNGKVALVTGGSSGIGRATALAFAREGAKVAIVDIDLAGAEATAAAIIEAGGEALAVAADITQAQQVTAAIRQVVVHFGRLDVACNNAGIEIEKEPLARSEESQFDQIMAVNVKGTWLCMKHEIEQMLAQGQGGAIVNIASVAGVIGAGRQPIYAASKHAVVGLTQSAAVEYGRRGIRINSVCPGVIDTAMTERAIALEPRRAQHVVALHPIGRLGEAEEIAEAVLFLCSNKAGFVLGHQLLVDGGMTAV